MVVVANQCLRPLPERKRKADRYPMKMSWRNGMKDRMKWIYELIPRQKWASSDANRGRNTLFNGGVVAKIQSIVGSQSSKPLWHVQLTETVESLAKHIMCLPALEALARSRAIVSKLVVYFAANPKNMRGSDCVFLGKSYEIGSQSELYRLARWRLLFWVYTHI